jgi:hypothetical protein
MRQEDPGCTIYYPEFISVFCSAYSETAESVGVWMHRTTEVMH